MGLENNLKWQSHLILRSICYLPWRKTIKPSNFSHTNLGPSSTLHRRSIMADVKSSKVKDTSHVLVFTTTVKPIKDSAMRSMIQQQHVDNGTLNNCILTANMDTVHSLTQLCDGHSNMLKTETCWTLCILAVFLFTNSNVGPFQPSLISLVLETM